MPDQPTDFLASLREELSPEDVVQVLHLLRGDITRLDGALQEAAAAKNAKAFRIAAHGMAGAASTVSMDKLEQTCRRAMTEPWSNEEMPRIALEIARLANAALKQIAAALVEES